MRKCRQLHQQFTHTRTERLITKQTISVIGKPQGAGSNANFSGSGHWKTYRNSTSSRMSTGPFCVVECRYRMSSKDRETDISQAVDQLDRTSVNK